MESTGDAELDQKIAEWFQWDRNSTTRRQMEEIVRAKNIPTLRSYLLNRLSFGTAGIRGAMRTGYSGMNDLVIIQTTQGLCSYLIQTIGLDAVSKKGVVIGFDSRHNSSRFAKRASTVFLSKKIKVYLFGSSKFSVDETDTETDANGTDAERDATIDWSLDPNDVPSSYHTSIVPTPFIPFSVTRFCAVAGIMITASHNPKEDNGYKVYFENGAQIIPPHDQLIQSAILENLQPWDGVWSNNLVPLSSNGADSSDKEKISGLNLLIDPYEEINKKYFALVKNQIFDSQSVLKSGLKVTFTALHGVGHKFLKTALDGAGIQSFPVTEQMVPDPEFPTVAFPNPEEGSGVLDLSIRSAQVTKSDIILANDPDADRITLAEKAPNSEGDPKWHIFSGNEIGTLLGWWIWFSFQERMRGNKLTQSADSIQSADCYMMSSAVSSSILSSMASKEGFNFIETLTGFKWMGNIAHELIKANKTVLFCFEEAIGFMVPNPNAGGAKSSADATFEGAKNGSKSLNYRPIVLDKDGISAGVELASMASYLRVKHQRSLLDQLSVIYETYGYHFAINDYFICHDKEVIKNIFEELKERSDARGGYISKIGPFKISRVRDLRKPGFDSSTEKNVPTLPTSSSSYMTTFYFSAENMKVTIRTSGTEPKVKYYSEIIGVPSNRNWKELEETLKQLIKYLISDILKPKERGLIERKD